MLKRSNVSTNARFYNVYFLKSKRLLESQNSNRKLVQLWGTVLLSRSWLSAFSLSSHGFMREKGSKLSQVSYQGTNPIMRAHFHDLITSQRPHLPIPLQWHLVLRISTYEFWGRHKHEVQNTGSKGIHILHFDSYY